MYPGSSMSWFSEYPDWIWNFFEYLAHDTWEYEQTRQGFSHAKTIPCAPFLCDYCESSDHLVDACPSLTMLSIFKNQLDENFEHDKDCAGESYVTSWLDMRV